MDLFEISRPEEDSDVALNWQLITSLCIDLFYSPGTLDLWRGPL